MFIRFITSRLLRVIVCAAAGLYGLYNAISCFVTLYKAGHQPYLIWPARCGSIFRATT